MNSNYRIVFNPKTAAYKLASARGKGGTARTVLGSGLTAVLLWGTGCAPAWSLPFLMVDNLPATTFSGGPITDYGGAFVGMNAAGQLNIENAAAISAIQSYIGWAPTATGVAILTGAGSNWTSGVMYVGFHGTGTVNVEAGAAVINDVTIIASEVGSQGSMTVSGSNSRLTSSTELGVGALGTGSLNIKAGGTVQSVISTIGGVSDDSQAKSGNGTVNVSGLGSSFVSSYALLVGYSGTGKLTIEDGATASAQIIYLGGQSGVSGELSVNGAGSQLTGSTLIVGAQGIGTLNISNGGLVNSADATIALGAASTGVVSVSGLDAKWLNQSGTVIVGGTGNGTLNISDGGAVFADSLTLGQSTSGRGVLALSGTEGRRGVLQTSIVGRGTGAASLIWEGGVLRAQVNNTNVISGFVVGEVDVRSGGAFIDSNGYDIGLTTAGLLAGVGGLTKQGAGTLSLAGSNTYAGNTTVSEGRLLFDSYAQSASQTLGIGVSGNVNYGKLAVTNAANFAADARIAVDVRDISTLAKDQILAGVISAGTLNASTFNVTDNSAIFNFRAAINGNAVDLTVLPGVAVYDAVRNSGASGASGAAQVFDDIINNGSTGDMGAVVTALGSLATQGEVGRAVSQTLPAQNAGVTQVGKGVLNTVNKLIENRQGDSSGISGGDNFSNRSAWLKPFGSRASQDDKDGISGFNATTWGLAGGIEGDLRQGTRIGLAYAYANSKVNGNTALSGAQQRVDVDAHVLALYGATELANGMTLGFQGDIGQNSNDGTRNINFGGLNRTATSDYKTYTAHAGISLAKSLALDERTSITPRIRADYTWLRDQGYREQGANALNLDVAKNSSEAFVLGADARISHVLNDRSRIEAYAGAGYDTINKAGNIVASYAGSLGQVFATPGVSHSPWLFAGGLGYVHQTMGGTEISLRYDVEGRSDYTNQSASVKAKWAF
ncbi:autotransporter domain-containing protein [Herminiimonas glaciei]|uniref:Autotransporter domain-containing protein n=1 Tax=Herminiimonas glaciei TaxID=523788 RepID=A0ABW2I8K7_9BURK